MIIVCGDVHGEWKALVNKVVSYNLTNTSLIIAGDCGFGFNSVKHDIDTLIKLNEFFKSRNIVMHLVRGNHDNPSFWIKSRKDDFTNIVFQKDYSRILNNTFDYDQEQEREIVFIGGAVSIDRDQRIEHESWWANEIIVKEPARRANIIISHDCPTFVSPMDFKHKNNEDAYHNAKILDMVYDEMYHKPELWVHGHFHISKTTFFENTKFVSLDILEFYEI